MIATLLAGVLVAGCATTDVGANGKLAFGPLAPRTDRAAAMGHYITSVYLERLGRIPEAFEELKQVPELDKTAVYPSLRLIRTFVRAQEFDKARVLAENAVQQIPDNPALWIMLGEVYHQLKQYDEAIDAFNKAIALNPDNVHGYGALAEVLETTNDLVSSLEIYEKLVKLNPDSAGLQFQLGATLVRMNDREGAVEAFKKTIALNPGFSQARYMLGTLYLELNRPEESVHELATYIAQRAGDSRALEVLAGALGRLGRNEEALATLRAVLATESALPKHHVLASLLLLRAGKPVEAEQAAPPTAPIYGTLMRALARKAQGLPYQPLIESLDTAESDVDQESVEILNDLIYLLGKDIGGAWLYDEFTKLQEGVTTSRTLTMARARILFGLDRYQEAAAILEGLLADGPADKTLLYYLSDANEKLKNISLAEKYLLAYLELDPANPEMLNFLGYMYADQNMKLDDAEKLIRKALDADPGNPYYLDSLGWVYYRRGKGKEAVEAIQQAIHGMNSDDAILRDHLGDAYLLNGEPQKAVGEWKRALRLDPKLKGVQEKISQHDKP